MINGIIKVALSSVINESVNSQRFSYDVEVSTNSRALIQIAKEIDRNFRDCRFFIQMDIIRDNNGYHSDFNGVYFYNSMGQRIYLICGLSNFEYNCVESYCMMITSKH